MTTLRDVVPMLLLPLGLLLTQSLLAASALGATSDTATPKTKPKAKAKASQPAAAKPKTPARAALAPSAQKAVEERTPIEDEPTHALSPAELEMARTVHVGVMACELGTSVTIANTRHEGFFLVSTSKGLKFRMHPTESRTGAIRLEDPKRGAMWLQLGNKSMLMSQKLGQRLADECQSPAQIAVAEAMKKNPPPSLLDAPTPAASAAPAN